MPLFSRVGGANIWDCAGQSEFYAAQELLFTESSIFVIVVSIVDPNSIANAQKWLSSLSKYRHTTMIAVTKVDLVFSLILSSYLPYAI